MTHLTRDELERWWDGDTAIPRDRIIEHLATCDECAALYGRVIDARPVEQPAATHPAEVVALGYGAHRPPTKARLAWGAYLTLAAAAAVILAIVVMPGPQRESTPVDSGIRGPSVQLLSPVGEVVRPTAFTWASALRAVSFRVDVYSDEGAVPLFSIASGAERATVPPELAARLQPGVHYLWRVTALDTRGAAIMQSEPQSFVIALPR